jgi:cytochrome c oxidase assembly protein subunit 11
MNKNRKLLILLSLVALAMTSFAFANQELYALFCQAVGISQSPNDPDMLVNEVDIDEDREVKVVFTTSTMKDVPVAFAVKEQSFPIVLGNMYENEYTFKNQTADTLYFRPIHSVFPPSASNKYSMVKCFCFDDMILMPHEELVLPLSFRFSPDVDPKVNRIVMNYTLVTREKDDVVAEENL